MRGAALEHLQKVKQQGAIMSAAEFSPVTKEALDLIFKSKVETLLTDGALSQFKTSDEIVGRFYQALLQTLQLYIDIYTPLKAQTGGTWVADATIQLALLQARHIDYSQGAQVSPALQLTKIFEDTQQSLQGSLAWQVAASLAHLANYVASLVVTTPKLGSILHANLETLHNKFENEIKNFTPNQTVASEPQTAEKRTLEADKLSPELEGFSPILRKRKKFKKEEANDNAAADLPSVTQQPLALSASTPAITPAAESKKQPMTTSRLRDSNLSYSQILQKAAPTPSR